MVRAWVRSLACASAWLLAVGLGERSAAAAEPTPDYTTSRYEPAGLPLIGGDTDIGFEFGVVGTLSHFADGIAPYRWNMDLLLSASVKSGPNGAEIEQQQLLWNFDMPGLFGGRLR